MTYDELGPVQVPPPDVARRGRPRLAPGGRRAAGRLRPRAFDLALPTLEEFLHRRGNISATAEALFVHPNTLRQRLRRIMEISELDLRRDDWLMVEIAVKLVKLRLVLGAR